MQEPKKKGGCCGGKSKNKNKKNAQKNEWDE